MGVESFYIYLVVGGEEPYVSGSIDLEPEYLGKCVVSEGDKLRMIYLRTAVFTDGVINCGSLGELINALYGVRDDPDGWCVELGVSRKQLVEAVGKALLTLFKEVNGCWGSNDHLLLNRK